MEIVKVRQKEILMAIWMQMETVTDWLMERRLERQKQTGFGMGWLMVILKGLLMQKEIDLEKR